jgi:hypothetical protein
MDKIEVLYDSFSDTSSTKTNHIKFQGTGLECLGQPSAPVPERQVFITLNISPKQLMVLNKGTRRRWGDYMVAEQFKILSRYRYYLDTISDSYECHWEFTKDNNLHAHCVVTTSSYDKDIRIGSTRFFSIPSEHSRAFCDIRLVEDYDSLIQYLTCKDKKKYQTTNIPPYIKIKTIDELN